MAPLLHHSGEVLPAQDSSRLPRCDLANMAHPQGYFRSDKRDLRLRVNADRAHSRARWDLYRRAGEENGGTRVRKEKVTRSDTAMVTVPSSILE